MIFRVVIIIILNLNKFGLFRRFFIINNFLTILKLIKLYILFLLLFLRLINIELYLLLLQIY